MRLSLFLSGLTFLATLGGVIAIGAEADRTEVDQTTFPSQELELKHGRYWIGLRCAEIPDPVRAQLNLNDEEGLMVAHVLDGSPAENAGIRRYDVLLKADGAVLRDVEQLVNAVQNSANGPLRVELMRQGNVETVEVTPMARQPFPFADGAPRRPEMDRALEWLERNRLLDESGRRYRVFQPGVWIDAFQQMEFPENTSIHIERIGDGPMKIRVKRDGDTWEVSRDSLDQLPEDVRAYVERLQARTTKQLAPYLNMVEGFLNQHKPTLNSEDFELELDDAKTNDMPNRSSSIEKRLEQILDRLDQIEERIEK